MYDNGPKVQVSVDEIEQDLSAYLFRVETGETFIITESGHPRAELKPLQLSKDMRPFGLCAGEFVVPEDFDDPLPEHILRGFEGK